MSSIMGAVDYSNPRSFGSWLRRRRIGEVRRLIEAIAARKDSVQILDLGGRRTYWNLFEPEFLEENRVKVTLLNYEPRAGRTSWSGCATRAQASRSAADRDRQRRLA